MLDTPYRLDASPAAFPRRRRSHYRNAQRTRFTGIPGFVLPLRLCQQAHDPPCGGQAFSSEAEQKACLQVPPLPEAERSQIDRLK